MNFDYNEEQQLLADSVRRFLEKEYDFEKRRRILAGEGWSAEAWAKFAEMGLTGLPLPAEHGGFGGGAVDLMGVMEAFGEALVLEPYLPTILAARLVARAGSAAQKQAILPAVVEGRMKLALALSETGAVSGAPVADYIVLAAGSDLYLLEKEHLKVRRHRAMDGAVEGEVEWAGARRQPLAREAGALVEETLDFGAALACAEAVGAMKFACDTTLEYLKTRKQFGVPIGTFQALQHRVVDMFISQEQARSMACLACSKVDSAADAAERARAVSAAKVRVGDAARHVSQEAVQLHGGMGMSEELKVSHTFRRLTVVARLFGDTDRHLERFTSF